jgi:predicted DNA-binding protein
MMTREEWRMSASKRATVYLDPELHKALRLKSAETARTVSDLVNEAVRDELAEDADDLAVFEARKDEGLVTFEDFVKELKRVGKI